MKEFSSEELTTFNGKDGRLSTGGFIPLTSWRIIRYRFNKQSDGRTY